MRVTAVGFIALLAAASCSKCGEAPKPTESVKEVAPKEPAVGDLRTSLIAVVPEFRGVQNLDTIAVLERVLAEDPADGGDLVGALQPWFKDKNWKPAELDGGILIAQNKPYFLEAERVNGEPVLRVGLVIPGEQVVKLLQSPAPLTTQQLGVLMPHGPNVKIKRENYLFEAHYFADDERATYLIRNLTAGHLTSGWKLEEAPPQFLSPDSGNVSSSFKAVLRDPSTHGTLTIGRAGNHNAITWEQPLTR